MNIVSVDSHQKLQSLSELLTSYYIVEDPFVLRSAIIEGIQNTIQHSNGTFALKIEPDLILIINSIWENDHPKYGLGLELYQGITTFRKGNLFYTIIYPEKVTLKQLDLDLILNS